MQENSESRTRVRERRVYFSVSHDEAYLYLLLQRHEGEWDFSEEQLDLGFGTLPDGSPTADAAPGITFPDGVYSSCSS